MLLDATDGDLPSIEMEPFSSQAIEARFRHCYPERIDFNCVKDWIENCNSSHTKCKLSSKMQLHDLRVIGCLERVVIPAPSDCSFVALSYVWGKLKFESYTLAAALPRTIEDSITLTRRLGYRYLWVDKFCIEQDNAMDKHLQIQQMGAIYASAEVTLIAAVGKDPTHGLPGTSHNRSISGLCEMVDGKLQFRHPLPVDVKIAQSTWMTRAWTFQEAYLSRRRLYFTDHKIILICSQSNRQEKIPRESHDDFYYTLDGLIPIRNRDLGHCRALTGLQIAMDMLAKYTSRELSYDSDALNAISGVLNSLNKGDTPIGNIWGVPFANHTLELNAPILCINWCHLKEAVRRPGFPSWSPLGWKGRALFCRFKDQYSPSNRTTEPRNDNEFWCMSKLLPNAPFLLEITTSIVQLQVVDVLWAASERQGVAHIILPIHDDIGHGRSVYIPVQWDINDVYAQKTKSVTCAITSDWAHVIQNRADVDVKIIILRSHGQFYERIGFTQTSRGLAARNLDRSSHRRGVLYNLNLDEHWYPHPWKTDSRGTDDDNCTDILWMRGAKEETILLG